MTACKPFNPFDWVSIAIAQQRLMMGATETIFHRSMLLAAGSLTPVEMVAMVFEKPSAFAKGFEKAAVAAARGKSGPEVIGAFYDPMTRKARSNARRLRG